MDANIPLITPKQAKNGWIPQGKAILTRAYGLVLRTPQRPKGNIVRLDCFIAIALHKPTGKRKTIRHTAITRELEFQDNHQAITWAEKNAGQQWPIQLYKDPWATGWRETFAQTACNGSNAFAARIIPFFDPNAPPTPKGKIRLAANRITEEAIAFNEHAETAGKSQLTERLKKQNEPRNILRMDKVFAKAAEATITRAQTGKGIVEIAPQTEPQPEILALFTATACWGYNMQTGLYKTKTNPGEPT